MLLDIISHTPPWVFALLLLLILLGWRQTQPRVVPRLQVLILPAAMFALSAYGAATSFGAPAVDLALWMAGAAVALLTTIALRWHPRGASFEQGKAAYVVPGSWVPMLLILAIFLTKYAVNVALALRPEWKSAAWFGMLVCGLYGIFGGIFLSRGLAILRSGSDPDGTKTESAAR